MLIKNKELNNMNYNNVKDAWGNVLTSRQAQTKSKVNFLIGRSKGDTAELERLWKLYDEAHEKYNKKIDALTAKRDYEVDYIWKEICKLEGSK
jgi:hypothetical protein